MLDALLAAGLVQIHPGLPNAEVFVKHKSAEKAALIINMRALNARCPTPPPKFRLPTLIEIGAILHTHQAAGGAAIATLDLANCFWSIRLPPSNVGCVRVGTPLHTYALLCVPFGWTHAPGLAQQVVQRHLFSLAPACLTTAPSAPTTGSPFVSTCQYLDDAALVSSSPVSLQAHADSATARLIQAGFLISPKSVLQPQSAATFIGKRIDAGCGTISSLPAYYAGVLLQWLALACGTYTRRKCSRLLGKLVWLAHPRRRILPFLAGPYTYLRHGPPFAAATSPNFVRATLEALAMCLAAWRTTDVPASPSQHAPRYFADAAKDPAGQFYVGVWERRMGTRFFPCPDWVRTQQAAELYAALKALSLAAFRKTRFLHLYLDNHAAIHSILRGRARSPLIPQNRILRRLSHLLHWSALTAAVHYVPSASNPADPPSRWWSFPSAAHLVARTWGLGQCLLSEPPGPSWGVLRGVQRAF
jgi:hypothetical protein